MKRVSIYDLDGTIVCSLHRYRTIKDEKGTERIDLEHWKNNQHLTLHDSLLPLASVYKNDLKDHNCYVIIATSRILNNLDYEFINTRLGKPNYIISREDGNLESGASLKIKGLEKVSDKFRDSEVVFYEDNITYLKSVCDYFNITGVYVPSRQGH